MTLPAPPPEKGTRIGWGSTGGDELLTVDVEENAPAVELSGRISQLTSADGLPIWVNLANVLYVERHQAGGLKRETGRGYLDMRRRPRSLGRPTQGR